MLLVFLLLICCVFFCLGHDNAGVSGVFDSITSDEEGLLVPVRMSWNRTHRSRDNVTAYSAPFRGDYRLISLRARLPRTNSVMLGGGDRIAMRRLVVPGFFRANYDSVRYIPVGCVVPVVRESSPSRSRDHSRSPSLSPSMNSGVSTWSRGASSSGYSRGSLRSGGSTRSNFSDRNLYPEYIPPPMMVEQNLMSIMRSISGAFYGYDRSLRELAHWREWYG